MEYRITFKFLQSRARPAHRSGPHYRNRFGVVPFSQNLAEETQRVIPGGHCSILLPLRPTGYAPAERNSILLTFNVPRWARLNRRSGPNQLAKSSLCRFSGSCVVLSPFAASICSLVRPLASRRFAPLRFAPLRFAPLRFASKRTDLLRSAALRFAALRSAALRYDSLMFASTRFARTRFAELRLASLIFAPLRFAPLRFAPLRFTPLRFALLRSAPLRSTWVRCADLRSR